MTAIWHGLARGAAAGAAGTCARLAAGQLDRLPTPPRPASGSIRGMTQRSLGTDTAAGAAIGAVAGALRSAGVRPPAALAAPLLGAAMLACTAGPRAPVALLVPRRRSEAGRSRDLLAALAYGVATQQALVMVSRVAEGREPVPAAAPATLVRAAALGAASGARSGAALSAVAATSTRTDPGVLPPRLASPAATAAIGLLTLAEAILDKLPRTGSRLQTAPLVVRAVAGAVAAGAMARREGDDPALPAVVGLGSATLGAVAGHRWRAIAAGRLGTDRPGALVEDVLAGVLSWYGSRRRTAAPTPPIHSGHSATSDDPPGHRPSIEA